VGREITSAHVQQAALALQHLLLRDYRDRWVRFQRERERPGEVHQRNVTVFADGEVDRSPCGSGTCARIAVLAADGRLPEGTLLRHDSIVGSTFLGTVLEIVVDDGDVFPVLARNAEWFLAQVTA